MYSFDDFNALITADNIIEVTAAVNDLKLSIFQIKNKGDFTKEKIEVAFKRKKDQFEKNKLKQVITKGVHANIIINKVAKDNHKNKNKKIGVVNDTNLNTFESKILNEKCVDDQSIPIEKKWESMDNF